MQCPRCNGDMTRKREGGVKARIRNHKLTLRMWVRCLGCGATYAGLKRIPVIDAGQCAMSGIGAAAIAEPV